MYMHEHPYDPYGLIFSCSSLFLSPQTLSAPTDSISSAGSLSGPLSRKRDGDGGGGGGGRRRRGWRGNKAA